MVRGCLTIMGCGAGALMVLAGGGLVALGVYGYRLENNTAQWPTVPGEVLESQPIGESEADIWERLTNVSVRVEYRYVVEDHAYTSDQVTFKKLDDDESRDLPTRYPEGAEVSVYYQPGDHGQAVLIPGRGQFGIIMIIIGAVIAVVGFLVALVMVRLLRRKTFPSESEQQTLTVEQTVRHVPLGDDDASAPKLSGFDLAAFVDKLSDRQPQLRILFFALFAGSIVVFFSFPLLTAIFFPLTAVAAVAYNLARLAQKLEDVGDDERAWSEERRVFAEHAGLDYTRTMLVGSSQRMLKSLEEFTLFTELRKDKPFLEQEGAQQYEKGMTKFLDLIGLNPMANLMHGLRGGHKMVIFDFRHRDPTQSNSFATIKVTPIVLQSDRFTCPQFVLAGHSADVTARSMKVNGLRELPSILEVGVESDFRLYGRDPDGMQQLFTLEFIRYFRDRREILSNVILEGNGDQLLLYRPGSRFTGEELESLIPTVAGAADILAAG